MRPSEFVAICPSLELAVQDINDFLNGQQEWENFGKELSRRMEAGDTPLEVKGWGRPVPLTKKQYMAFVYGTTVRGKTLTDEKREAILAELPPGEPMSDAGQDALCVMARGGWRESSRQAAVRLRAVGWTGEADGIEVALSNLPAGPTVAEDRQDDLDAMRNAAGQIRVILAACLTAGQKTSDGKDAPKAKPVDKQKKSTTKGDARNKIIAALTLHHKYQDGSCLYQEPIGVRELAHQADVSPYSAHVFFNSQFGEGDGKKKKNKNGHKRYINMCKDRDSLIASLKLLNGDYSPSCLYGSTPPGEGRDDPDDD